MTDQNPYDQFSYLTAAFKTAHPNRLATIATLFGMTPAPVPRCRVLELGCGDGGNLVPMAYSLPESSFVGIDLAERPIAAGQESISHLGIRNVTLLAKDLLTVTPELGQFDYIIAHGVYAWVPAPVQDKLMAICGTLLAPNGVAFVSYNCYPGSKLREMARDMFLQFVRPLDTSERSRGRVRELLGFAGRERPETGEWGPIMRQVSEFLASHPDRVLGHDEMGDCYRPAYFHEFVEHAGRHGLKFLGEAQYSEMFDRWLTPEELEPLSRLDGDPLILREQYMDFLRCRTFRQTLLCRRETALHRDLILESVMKLLVSSQLRPASDRPELTVSKPEEFRTPLGSALTVTIPQAKRLLVRLAGSWPRPIPATELVSPDSPARNVAQFLLQLYGLNLLDLPSHWNPFVSSPGERPTASSLARLQIERQDRVTNLEHVDVQVSGQMGKELLRRLDGTRDRAALLADLRAIDPQITPESLEASLKGLALLSLLSA